MTKIKHYQLVNPLEVVTFESIHELESNFKGTDQFFDVDYFLKDF